MYQVESAQVVLRRKEAASEAGSRVKHPRARRAHGHPARRHQPADRHLLGDGRDDPADLHRLRPRRRRRCSSASSTASTRARRRSCGCWPASRPTARAATRRWPWPATRSPPSASWACCSSARAWRRSSAVVYADRIGKGIRTAPRDALISLSAHPKALGAAFGVHRAMDTAGAMLGPLLAFGLLAAAPRRYDAIFVVSFCFAIVGVGGLVLLVRDRRAPRRADPPSRGAPRMARALGLLRVPRLPPPRARRRRCSASATLSDAFLYLGLQRPHRLRAALLAAALRRHRRRLHGPRRARGPAGRPRRARARLRRRLRPPARASTARCCCRRSRRLRARPVLAALRHLLRRDRRRPRWRWPARCCPRSCAASGMGLLDRRRRGLARCSGRSSSARCGPSAASTGRAGLRVLSRAAIVMAARPGGAP